MTEIDIQFTNDFQEACHLRDQGYEPIECAFGQFGSVMGPLCMDHHGVESHREGVALRACRDAYGARQNDPRFVVTGAPDADAVLSIIALAALVDQTLLKPEFYVLVNEYDTDPIGIDLTQSALGTRLAWFNQLPNLTQSEDGFRTAIAAMLRLLKNEVPDRDIKKVQRADENRRRVAAEGIIACYSAAGQQLALPEDLLNQPVRRAEDAVSHEARVLVVQSVVWGFDLWYRAAPIVVSYASRLKKVTVGCPDVPTAERLFGPGGLNHVWKVLGRGWGGRESIGGSPRGVSLELADAHKAAHEILDLLKRAGRPLS